MKKNCRTETLHQLFNMHTQNYDCFASSLVCRLLCVADLAHESLSRFPTAIVHDKLGHIVRMRSELYALVGGRGTIRLRCGTAGRH